MNLEQLNTKSSELKTTPEKLSLSPLDMDKIIQITAGIDVIPDSVKAHASQDIYRTLEISHPLNKIWRNEQDEITGYLVFEDFKEHEAYAKYFGTDGTLTENPFSFIPELIQQARDLGYKKIHFHGWNKRLNKVLEHFGFVRTHTDKHGGLSADHFEIRLDETKDQDGEKKTQEAFEQKYKLHLIRETEQTIKTLKPEQQTQLTQSEQELSRRLEQQENFELSDIIKVILKLKLARYLQRHDSIDINTLFDAIIETPKFIDKDKGGFDRLLELHEQKTLEKIAELRKRKAEQTGKEEYNPYEALFQTDSGEYYMARLLNMPHLEEESQYMNHCVGTSDSYISKMKKGDVEILSFRKTPKFNPQTQKLEGDEPIITIEYNVRTKTIQQIKKYDDEFIQESDPFFQDFIEALKKLKETEHDTGEKRNFREISNSELENIKVKDYHLFTEQGEINFKDFDPESNIFVLKMGNMDITPQTPKEDASLIFRTVEGTQFKSEDFACSKEEVNENTKVYIGEWNPIIFETIKQFPNITHLYESFPDKKIFVYKLETDPVIQTPEQAETKLKEKGMSLGTYAKDILYKTKFSQELKEYNLVCFSVAQLGLPSGTKLKDICAKAKEIVLDLCPAEVGPQLRLQYDNQYSGEYLRIAMDAIPDRDGDLTLFDVYCDDGRLWLIDSRGTPDREWSDSYRFVFVSRKY